jgi:hypothetical protein
MSTADTTQVLSTAFAAVAAVGSAGAAWVMHRQWTATSTPGVSVDVAKVFPKGTLYLNVVNYGGPVKKVSFVVIEGDQACMSFLPPHGFLGPGERVQLKLGLDSPNDAPDDSVAVAYGFDLASRFVYAWATNGKAERWPARSTFWRRRPTNLNAVQILQRLYPQAPDPTKLEQRGSALMPQPILA